jgi:phosphate transport system substrate-binding protein
MLIVMVREEEDSSMKLIENKFSGLDKVFEESFKENRWQEYYTDAEMALGIIDTPASFGLTDSGAITAEKLNIKPLTLNGIAPTVENIKNGKYPLVKDLYFIYKDNLTEGAKKFLDFVKSEKGTKLIINNGGLPIKE